MVVYPELLIRCFRGRLTKARSPVGPRHLEARSNKLRPLPAWQLRYQHGLNMVWIRRRLVRYQTVSGP